MADSAPHADPVVRELLDRAERSMHEGAGTEAISMIVEAAERLADAGALFEALELCARHRIYGPAAQIAERHEEHGEAAQLWFRAGDLVRSAESRLQAGAPTMAGELFERAGAHERAAEIFEQEGDYARASILWEQAGRTERAAELLRRALTDESHQQIVGPEATEVCRRAAVLFAEVGRVDDAVSVLRFGEQPVFAGKLLARAGRTEEAIDTLVEAGDYLSAAQIAKETGDERRAQLLLAERAENEGRLLAAASHHEVVGDWGAASRLYEFAGDLRRAAHAHERAGHLEAAGRIWERLGEAEAAARCYRGAGREHDAEALEAKEHLEPEQIAALASEGRHLEAAQAVLTHARRGDRARYAEVETYLGRVAKGHPEHHAAQAMLAEVLEEQGQTSRALDVLQRLLLEAKARPEHVPAFFLYGNLLEHAGYLAAARNAYRTAATFDPGFRDVSERLARLKEFDAPETAGPASPSRAPIPRESSRTMELFDQALEAMSGVVPADLLAPALVSEVGSVSEATSFEALLSPGPDRAAGLSELVRPGAIEEVTDEGPGLPAPSLRADSLVGRVLRGRFRIEKKLGRGSQAQVYLARDQVLDRKVAIKVLSESVADDQAALDRFLREARMAARVHHSGCLSIFDFGTEGGLTFMAMEYFRGRTLRDLIKKGPIEPYLALRLLRDVVSALAAVHDAGIVHRDIKPTNVMVDRNGRVRITDFGVARTLDDEDSGGMMVGTMKYMAPEQARAKEVDWRADLFSVGVVMYEMLNGKPPFGGTLDALIARVTEPPPPLPSTVQVSEEVRRIVRRCMAKSPRNRYESMEQLVEDLSSEISKLKAKRRSRQHLAQARRAKDDAPASGPSSAAVTAPDAPAPEPRVETPDSAADTGADVLAATEDVYEDEEATQAGDEEEIAPTPMLDWGAAEKVSSGRTRPPTEDLVLPEPRPRVPSSSGR